MRLVDAERAELFGQAAYELIPIVKALLLLNQKDLAAKALQLSVDIANAAAPFASERQLVDIREANEACAAALREWPQ